MESRQLFHEYRRLSRDPYGAETNSWEREENRRESVDDPERPAAETRSPSRFSAEDLVGGDGSEPYEGDGGLLTVAVERADRARDHERTDYRRFRFPGWIGGDAISAEYDGVLEVHSGSRRDRPSRAGSSRSRIESAFDPTTRRPDAPFADAAAGSVGPRRIAANVFGPHR